MFFLTKLPIMHFSLFFFFFPQYQQLKRVFKYVYSISQNLLLDHLISKR